MDSKFFPLALGNISTTSDSLSLCRKDARTAFCIILLESPVVPVFYDVQLFCHCSNVYIFFKKTKISGALRLYERVLNMRIVACVRTVELTNLTIVPLAIRVDWACKWAILT